MYKRQPQGNTILSGTIAENLRMVKQDATDEEMIEALKISWAWDFVKEMDETIYTKIGERGRGVSEGQAQRIAIARAAVSYTHLDVYKRQRLWKIKKLQK